MAATVVSLPLPQPHEVSLSVDNPAEARKRRREKLASQRSTTATPDSASSMSSISVANKKQKVMEVTSSSTVAAAAVVSPLTPAKKVIGTTVTTTAGGKGKKPQMKYDPDVPMTKEEAAAWRREQRRKRNRESAAASRQRQRDRIVELEAEVEDWKSKFDEVMNKIRQLEEAKKTGQKQQDHDSAEPVTMPADCSSSSELEDMHNVQEQLQIHSPEALVEEVFRDTVITMVSPNTSPRYTPRSVSPPSPSSSVDFPQVEAVKVVSKASGGVSQVEVEEASEESQPSKMISRPA